MATEKHNVYDAAGNPVHNCYMPHLPLTASNYARTKKVFALFREQFQRHMGKDFAYDCQIWEEYLLMLNEHLARELKIDGEGVHFVLRQSLPLPRSEWLVEKRKAERQEAATAAPDGDGKQPVTGELLRLLRETMRSVLWMRDRQKAYFKCHTVDNLNAARVAESRCDELVARVMNFGKPKVEQRTLFDT